MTDARSDILPLCSKVEKPFVPFSTRNPRTTPSSFAQTTATSAIGSVRDPGLGAVQDVGRSPSFFATVRMPAGFEPKSGSVSPKQPIASALASFGIQRSFCSFEPKA